MNKKSLIVILTIFFSVSNIFAQTANPDKSIRAELIGVWQASSSVGSGMDDNFQFFADGKFKFNYNQMDGLKRINNYSGNWKVEKGKLVLTITDIEFRLGGRWVRSSGSIATEYEIEGGQIFKKRILPAEKQTLELTGFVREELHKTTKIDDIKYWKLSGDPKTYEN